MSADLGHALHRLGLSQYQPILIDNGFDSWDVLCDITEHDLMLLGFKLGHRRLLQREIATSRGLHFELPETSEESIASQLRAKGCEEKPPTQSEAPNGRQKRRYRRKPRPDDHAPKKPKTAYVNFANAQRASDPHIKSLSFEDSAREVGKRWQALSPELKHAWERQAAQAYQEYEAQMDEYKKTENYRRYQSYLRLFKQDGTHAPVEPKATRPTPLNEVVLSETRSPSSDGIASANPPKKIRHDSTHSVAEDCRAALELAMEELKAKRIEHFAAGVPVYDKTSLPPEGAVRKGAQCCIVGTGCIIYLVASDQMETMLDQVFGPKGTVDPKSIIFSLVIAAIGAHYDFDCMPEPMRQGMYASAILIFESAVPTFDDYTIMQILLIFSVYSLLEKHMAIRHIITAGLKISRWKFPTLKHDLPNQTDQDTARKVINTLIFMDCWLSTTLGYKSDVSMEDLEHAWIPPCDCISMNDAIHAQGSKIGLVSRDIAELTVHQAATDVKAEHIAKLTKKLDAWYNELPATMHLSTLIDPNKYSVVNFFQRRAILMLHMFYLGAIISLYRQVLLNASNARIQSQWNLDVAYSQVQDYRARCSMAAQQMTRIMTLIDFTSFMTRRCWVLIYWSFHSCTVILFNAAQQILDGDLRSPQLNTDLASAKLCIEMLDSCAQAEPVSAKHLALIQPLYEALARYHGSALARPSNTATSSAGYFNQQHQAYTHQKDHSAVSTSPPGSSSRSTVSTPASTMSSSSANSNLMSHSNNNSKFSPTSANGNTIDMPPPLDGEVVSIAKKLGELLANPFGMGIEARVEGVRREGANKAGTYSVLWWK